MLEYKGFLEPGYVAGQLFMAAFREMVVAGSVLKEPAACGTRPLVILDGCGGEHYDARPFLSAADAGGASFCFVVPSGSRGFEQETRLILDCEETRSRFARLAHAGNLERVFADLIFLRPPSGVSMDISAVLRRV